VIIEAAKRWVEAADAPRFLPPLVKWLSAGGWNNDPPQKRTALPAKKRAASSAKRRGKADLATLSLMTAAMSRMRPARSSGEPCNERARRPEEAAQRGVQGRRAGGEVAEAAGGQGEARIPRRRQTPERIDGAFRPPLRRPASGRRRHYLAHG
jgi:hypothetical protein